MTDVLKDMGKVKLKKVDRCANGTPVKPPAPQNTDDPATLIALALRKRFAQMNQINDSPERNDCNGEREREDSFSEAADNHIITPSSRTNTRPRIPSPKKLFVCTRTEATAMDNSTAPFGQHLLRKTGKKAS